MDPITIAGLLATLFSTGANMIGVNKANDARDDALAAERIRQKGLDDQAAALNLQSQARYNNVEGQKDEKAKSLTDYFKAPPETLDEGNASAATAMPSVTGNSIVNAEMERQSAKASDFTGRQGAALAEMRSFGDMLGDTSRLQARDAGQIGQIGGFKAGSSNILPLELDAAAQKGQGWRTFGDILGGLGSIGTSYGITKGLAGLTGAAMTGPQVMTGTLSGGPSSVSPFAPGLSLYPGQPGYLGGGR